MHHPSFIFFGSSELSNFILDSLWTHGLKPLAIVTVPPQPRGRHLTITPSLTKIWADKHDIQTFEPESLLAVSFLDTLKKMKPDVFVVASYGKIIPPDALAIPTHGALNVHPSLLPKFRGASPIQSTILADEKTTGVTIMCMDSEMDHGPIVAQEKITVSSWPVGNIALEKELAILGGRLLISVLPDFVSKKILPSPQNHADATFCSKFEKKDARIDLADDAYRNFLKIKAFDRSPLAYTTVMRNGKLIRLIIKDAIYTDGILTLTRVIPEGKKEMNFADFLNGTQR